MGRLLLGEGESQSATRLAHGDKKERMDETEKGPSSRKKNLSATKIIISFAQKRSSALLSSPSMFHFRDLIHESSASEKICQPIAVAMGAGPCRGCCDRERDAMGGFVGALLKHR
jgi:hypothetical protein